MAKKKARHVAGRQRSAVERSRHTPVSRDAVVSAVVNGVVSLVAIAVATWLMTHGHDVGAFLAGVAGLLLRR